jgi:hypothetical protein
MCEEHWLRKLLQVQMLHLYVAEAEQHPTNSQTVDPPYPAGQLLHVTAVVAAG